MTSLIRMIWRLTKTLTILETDTFWRICSDGSLISTTSCQVAALIAIGNWQRLNKINGTIVCNSKVGRFFKKSFHFSGQLRKPNLIPYDKYKPENLQRAEDYINVVSQVAAQVWWWETYVQCYKIRRNVADVTAGWTPLLPVTITMTMQAKIVGFLDCRCGQNGQMAATTFTVTMRRTRSSLNVRSCSSWERLRERHDDRFWQWERLPTTDEGREWQTIIAWLCSFLPVTSLPLAFADDEFCDVDR